MSPARKARDANTLAEALGGHLTGPARPVTTLRSPRSASPESVVVISHAPELEALHGVQPALLVVPDGLEPPPEHPHVRVPDTRLALAQLSALFRPESEPAEMSPRAEIHPQAKLAPNVSVAPGAVIGKHAQIGAGTTIGANCVIGEAAVIGEGCVLHANVTLYPQVTLGNRVILHSGVVIGGDGFGYAFSARGALKIHHLGTVEIGDEVEIGANSCVDRATLDTTTIGARSKIDNLCQIAHNVQVGEDCLIAGLVGIGGSSVLGRGVIIGGRATISDHIEIGDGARVAGSANVIKNIPPGETWLGYRAGPKRQVLREYYLLSKLEPIWEFVKAQRLKGS